MRCPNKECGFEPRDRLLHKPCPNCGHVWVDSESYVRLLCDPIPDIKTVVDIGCVDCETEFLSPAGWKRIDEWKDGDRIMQYNPETGEGEFVVPNQYVRLPCEEFYWLKTKYGVNQRISPEHKVLYARYTEDYRFDKLDTISAEALKANHDEAVNGFRGKFLTTFIPRLETSLPVSNAVLRVLVAVAADGYIRNPHTGNVVLQLQKQRKIHRAKKLLRQAEILFTESQQRTVEGKQRTDLSFTPPVKPVKTLGVFWNASLEQLRVIADEVFHWDGSQKEQCFYTCDLASADFMSYCFTAVGYRAVLRTDPRDNTFDYRVFAQKNTKVGINGTPKTQIQTVPSVDGLKYCFTVPAGFWVMRRGGVVAVTGNCGMKGMIAQAYWQDRQIQTGYACDIHVLKPMSAPWVPLLMDAENLLDKLGPKSVDVVTSCGFAEHNAYQKALRIFHIIEQIAVKKVFMTMSALCREVDYKVRRDGNPYHYYKSFWDADTLEALGYTVDRERMTNGETFLEEVTCWYDPADLGPWKPREAKAIQILTDRRCHIEDCGCEPVWWDPRLNNNKGGSLCFCHAEKRNAELSHGAEPIKRWYDDPSKLKNFPWPPWRDRLPLFLDRPHT